jgi:hypothetical protein
MSRVQLYTWTFSIRTYIHINILQKGRGNDVVTTFGERDNVIGFNFDYKVSTSSSVRFFNTSCATHLCVYNIVDVYIIIWVIFISCRNIASINRYDAYKYI